MGHRMPILNDYLDVVEAADKLGIHWETVKRLCREHKIPAHKVHNKWLIHKDVLYRFAETYDNGRGNKSKKQGAEI
jgi:excisionase family DNA binding protein